MALPAPVIFRSLTRPTINRFGLPQGMSMYVLAGIFLFVLWFGNGRIWYYVVLMPLAWIIMRALVEYDPNFWRIFRLWMRTKFKTKRHTLRLFGGSFLAALPCGVADDAKDVASAL